MDFKTRFKEVVVIITFFLICSCMSPYGLYHDVQPGEDIDDLCAIYDVPRSEILRINELPAGTEIEDGRKIFIPGAEKIVHQKADRTSSPTSAKITLAKDYNYPPKEVPPPKTSVIKESSIVEINLEEEQNPEKAALEVANISTVYPDKEFSRNQKAGRDDLVWPISVEARKEVKFRKGTLLIEAAKGAEVLAAAGGTVIYLEKQVPGYGNMVIIDCNGKDQIIYGGLGAFSVLEGQQIERGESIGKLATGADGDGSTLLFEQRREENLIKPIFFLP